MSIFFVAPNLLHKLKESLALNVFCDICKTAHAEFSLLLREKIVQPGNNGAALMTSPEVVVRPVSNFWELVFQIGKV